MYVLCDGRADVTEATEGMQEEEQFWRSIGKEIVRQRDRNERGRERGQAGDAEAEPERGDDRTRCSLRH